MFIRNPKIQLIVAIAVALLFGLGFLFTRSNQADFRTTGLVLFEKYIPDETFSVTLIKGGSSVPELAHVRLEFINLPDSEEGNAFTLLGGGLNQTGFHSSNATGFVGLGYHFAVLEGEDSPNPIRDEAYKADFTRTVKHGRLSFDVYYTPTDINAWGERYFPGTELALTMMRAGTTERILHAKNNIYNWVIAGIGQGNSVKVVVDFGGGGDD